MFNKFGNNIFLWLFVFIDVVLNLEFDITNCAIPTTLRLFGNTTQSVKKKIGAYLLSFFF